MQIKNIKMTNRDWWLLIGFVVCCVLVAGMVGDWIIHASKDESDTASYISPYPLITKDQITCDGNAIWLPSGTFSGPSFKTIRSWCNLNDSSIILGAGSNSTILDGVHE